MEQSLSQDDVSSLPYSSLPTVSPSSVSDLGCSKKFWITRVLKQWPQRPSTPALTAAEFGTAFHAVMSGLYRDAGLQNRDVGLRKTPRLFPKEHPYPSETATGTWIPLPVFSPDMRHLNALTRAAFHARRYPSRAGREEDIEKCMEMVTHYVANEDEEDISGTLAVERWGEFVIEHEGHPMFMLSGKLDRVLVRASEPDRLIVRDYKTSRTRRVNLSEAFVLLWVARLCFPGYTRYTLEYDWLNGDGDVQRDVVEGSDVRGQHGWLLSRLRSLLEAEEHLAEPGDECLFCVLRPSCQPLTLASSNTGERLGTGP